MEDYKKKYEQALERAKVVNPGTTDYNIVTEIFPELKESEDERVRKELIRAFTVTADKRGHEIYGNGITYGQVLTWLEKQENVLRDRAGDIVHNMLEDKIGGIQRELIEFLSNTIEAKWTDVLKSADSYAQRIRNIIKKQGEQKTAWSEEDELMFNATLNQLSLFEDRGATKLKIDWLKSLKERMKGE